MTGDATSIKAELELNELRQRIRFDKIRLVLSFLQAAAVVVGIGFAVSEFVIKDRDAKNQRVRATLDYYEKMTSGPIVSAKEALIEYRELAYQTPVPYGEPPDEDHLRRDLAMRRTIAENFHKDTAALGSYFDILLSGVEKGIFEKGLVSVLFVDEAYTIFNLLDELRGRMGGPHTKLPAPRMQHFKSLEEFHKKYG
jgi:hypothetical protein